MNEDRYCLYCGDVVHADPADQIARLSAAVMVHRIAIAILLVWVVALTVKAFW